MISFMMVLQFFEMNPQYAATAPEWKSKFGEAYMMIDPFLRPTGCYANTIECEICGKSHKIIFCKNNKIKAEIPDGTICREFYVEHDQITTWTWSIKKLITGIDNRLGILPPEKFISIYPLTAFAGWCTLAPEHQIPVFGSAQQDPDELAMFIDNVKTLYNKSPFIVFSPTPQTHNGKVEKMLKSTGSVHLWLSDLLEQNDSNQIIAKRPIVDTIPGLNSHIVKKDISRTVLDRARKKNVFVRYCGHWIISMENIPLPLVVDDLLGIAMRHFLLSHPREPFALWEVYCKAKNEPFVPLDNSAETIRAIRKIGNTARKDLKASDKLLASCDEDILEHIIDFTRVDEKMMYKPNPSIKWITTLDELYWSA